MREGEGISGSEEKGRDEEGRGEKRSGVRGGATWNYGADAPDEGARLAASALLHLLAREGGQLVRISAHRRRRVRGKEVADRVCAAQGRRRRPRLLLRGQTQNSVRRR